MLNLLLQFKVRIWHKKKNNKAHINLLQLIVKLILFKCLIDPANFNQLLSSPIIKIIVLSLYRMP